MFALRLINSTFFRLAVASIASRSPNLETTSAIAYEQRRKVISSRESIEDSSQKLALLSIDISIEEQLLRLWQGNCIISTYPISSAKNGIGQLVNSSKTPLGKHRIHLKIGEDAPLHTIFKARKSTNICWSKKLMPKTNDLILTRVLVLEGLEKGFNQGYDSQGRLVDSLKRMIYIHGTPEEDLIGKPVSMGCIRMRNSDILALFDKVQQHTPVWIRRHF
jgi:L,D-transpeptidase YbiS